MIVQVAVSIRLDWAGGFVCANFILRGRGGRAGWATVRLHTEQILERAGVGALEAGLDAMEETEGAAGEAGESLGERLRGGERLVFFAILDVLGAVFFDVIDGVRQELGFDEGEAIETPFGGDDFVHQVEFDEAGGLELLEVTIQEALKLCRVFRGEDEGLTGEAMAERVLRRALFAGFGFWAVGPGAVFAGGLGFTKRGHTIHLGGSE